MKNFIKKVSPYVDALYPVIYLRTFERIKADHIIQELSDEDRNIFEWNGADGLVNFQTKQPLMPDMSLEDTLAHFSDPEQLEGVLLILKDIAPLIGEPKVIARLQRLINIMLDDSFEDVLANIIIVAPELTIPLELQKYITIFDVTLPTEDEIQHLIRNFAEQVDEEISPGDTEAIATSLKGLSEQEINALLRLSFQNGGIIEQNDKHLILQEKEQIIRKSGILEMIPLNESIGDIGGLERLKTWLQQKSKVFSNLNQAMAFGVGMPKGNFILGMPGCGKSLAAKATAHLFNLPLLRLDVGRIMGKYVGESEANMRNAINLAEAISPCVLWVDEIEKAFAGASGGGSEVTTRLFGFFLTWMQEKKAPVYVVATANDISNLPPELLRKGRFDETFFVDFPNIQERRQIFKIHLEKRNKILDQNDYELLAAKTDGFSGADIETVVKEGIEQAFVDGMVPVDAKRLISIIESTTSLSVMLKDRINNYRENYKRLNIKPASEK